MKPRGLAWRRLRANHLHTYPDCRICGETVNTVVHHLRYRSGEAGTYELPGDLVTLCRPHHERLHKHFGSTPKLDVQLDYIYGSARLFNQMLFCQLLSESAEG